MSTCQAHKDFTWYMGMEIFRYSYVLVNNANKFAYIGEGAQGFLYVCMYTCSLFLRKCVIIQLGLLKARHIFPAFFKKTEKLQTGNSFRQKALLACTKKYSAVATVLAK